MKKNIVIILGVVIFPFLIEWVIHVLIKNITCFNDDVWFSFFGSYVGAIITLIVMFITFRKTNKENQADKQFILQKFEIERDINDIGDLYNLLLLNDYDFTCTDANVMISQFRKFCKDFRNNETIIDIIKSRNNFNKEKDELLQKMEDLQTLEAELINNSNLFNPNPVNDILKEHRDLLYELTGVVEKYRADIRDLYKRYVDETYQQLFNSYKQGR